ncbi:MAG TPA: SDR family NAD(P)-dependent oxidoreductase [Dongiaceae bacterium]|jgi:hypothetical protein|nr:SDR family NAD(P)-dependent oxidoreductase [Dongiaceae bacterium]
MHYQSWYITGASSGIGAAFAHAAPPRTTLLLGGRDEIALGKLAAKIGDGAVILPGDLTLAAEREKAVRRAEEAAIDLLVLNAGIGQFGSILDMSPRREMEIAQLNMIAPIELVRGLLPGMVARAREQRRRAGLIIVSSIAAFQPMPGMAIYAASKAFLLSFGEALACELNGLPVDCLVLCPGTTQTQFFTRAGAGETMGYFVTSPEQVAREGLRALGRRPVHIVGWGNRLLAPFMRFIPHAITLPATFRFVRKRGL